MPKYSDNNREAAVGDIVVRDPRRDNSLFIAQGGDINHYYTVLRVEAGNISIEVNEIFRTYDSQSFALIRRGSALEHAEAEEKYRSRRITVNTGSMTNNSNSIEPRRYYATKTKSTITEFPTLEKAEEAAKTASSDAIIYECIPVARYITTRVREEVILTDGVKPNIDL